MLPLTEAQLRAALVNTSRRESAEATLPPLGEVAWDRLEVLGWQDRRQPLLAYVVAEVDGAPVGAMLRSTENRSSRRNAVCGWCEDLVSVEDVTLYVARRAGAAGRRGDTVGTLLCADLRCSRNVRRRPTLAESGEDSDAARAAVVAARITGLRERAARFLAEVASTR